MYTSVKELIFSRGGRLAEVSHVWQWNVIAEQVDSGNIDDKI